ncbi:metallophosphoesterase [Oceanobacillus senegalensis]|uniref:metallophosphoesterase n=1 Tax=Oceanobacillus senegalensis TaxID=1936063 RepID=UPI000A30884E|nr:metallophosphoesterase [Oceanobacillus senegalensis]
MKRFGFVTVIVFPILLFYMIYKAHRDKINYQTVIDEKLPTVFEGFRIFFISDIHKRRIKKTTLEKISGNIDIVVIGGDLTEGNVPFKRTEENLELLKRWNVPVFFVWGNNDYEKDYNQFLALLEKVGVTVLSNSSKSIVKNNQVMTIIGLDCSTYRDTRIDLASHETAGQYNVLLTHMPSSYFQLNNGDRLNINIVLAGHTHGGQIRIFDLGIYEPGSIMKYQNASVLISEGYGYTLLPFRLGTSAECHVVTIRTYVEDP